VNDLCLTKHQTSTTIFYWILSQRSRLV